MLYVILYKSYIQSLKLDQRHDCGPIKTTFTFPLLCFISFNHVQLLKEEDVKPVVHRGWGVGGEARFNFFKIGEDWRARNNLMHFQP